ncbi:hypothetical protein SVAN01_06702 [Stagonosporopsis vannaccii]|nr:hypothetical protein SVAN01_06702 [Stagonosporopsis vannaccii]
MTNTKLLKKLFKRRNDKDDTNDKATALSRSAVLSPTLSPPIRRQLVQNLETRPQPASLFFLLPGELRNRIYFYATYPCMLSIFIYKYPEAVLSANIFRICRRIRSEAISHLCASKEFNLSSLRIANEFFELVRDGIPSLRHMTIRCPLVWRMRTEEVEVEKKDLLDFLELASALSRLSILVENPVSSAEDEIDFEGAESVGVRFLHAVRNIVDRDACGMRKGREIRKRLSELCKQVGPDQAVHMIKGELSKVQEQQGDAVFRLCKVSRGPRLLETIDLSVLISEHLTRID